MNESLINILKRYDTTLLADGAGEFVSLDKKIKPIENSMKIYGPAYTVKLEKGDSSIIFKAIENASPGDIMVIDTSGTDDTAVWGDSKSLSARLKGLAGVVIDGAYRDLSGCINEGVPIFAKHLVVHGSGGKGLGELNIPIRVENQEICPGDIIVGDENGVIVLKQEIIERVIEGAEKKLQSDLARKQKIIDKYKSK